MVKRTVVVLGILSVIVLAAVPAMAQLIAANNWNSPINDCFGGFLAPRTLMLPVDCPDPIPRTIQKTWECKIEGPCPAPAFGGGAAFGPKSDDRLGWLSATCMALGTPLDFIFGGCDGVYGCVEFSDGPCGSVCGGPVATVLRSLSYTFYPTEGSFFGGLW